MGDHNNTGNDNNNNNVGQWLERYQSELGVGIAH